MARLARTRPASAGLANYGGGPWVAIILAAAVFTLAGCGGGGHSAAQTSARRPTGPLIGAMFDGAVLFPNVDLDRQLALAVSSGVESLRVGFDWSRAQPYRSFGEIPASQRGQFTDAEGVPTQFASTDRIVGAAARQRLSLLPVVLYSPAWATASGSGPTSSPPSPPAYAAFLRALVGRYGPHGSFWSSHPSIPAVPIRMWQIWNEPDFTRYWSMQPFAPSYVRLLAAAHAAIKQTDPGAQVVLAGFPEFSWEYLAQVYRVPGARKLFDVVAVHPYTAHPQGVIVILQRVRTVMDQFGDAAKPLFATEITWPSSQGKAPPQFGVGTTETMQAQLLGQVMPLLEANRAKLGLTGIYWYTWMGDESPSPGRYGFDYAGLVKYVSGQIQVKPALAAFKRWALALEHCSSKGAVATICG